MNCAPIILFAYNRPEHLKKTIASLLKNTLVSESELFIYSDGPKNPSDVSLVARVREILRGVSGFQKITTVERKENQGLAASVISGVSEIISSYGKVIVLEDDMILSPHFLQYMNEALETYKDEDSVGSVHGYLFPIARPMPETFFLRYSGCWGWGTWKRAWDLFEPDGKILREKLRGQERVFDFNNSYPFTQMLERQIAGKVNSWAIRWQASLFVHDKLTLWPGRSLVHNAGNDASGTHTGATSLLDVRVSSEPVTVGGVALEESGEARVAFEEYFRKLKRRKLSPRFIFSKIAQFLRKA